MKKPANFKQRRRLLMGFFGAGAVGLLGRGFDLEVLRGSFLRKQGDARYLRIVKISAHRGMILDRNGHPLAISTPMDSVWLDPQQGNIDAGKIQKLANLLQLDAADLDEQVKNAKKSGREFIWVKRLINPALGRRVTALKVPGVGMRREYKRFYPMGEVGSHVLGFTNIDDQGQDGLELEFNSWLTGKPGAKRVIKNGFGQVVQNVDLIRSSKAGRNLKTSLDQRIQYLAYRTLKAAVVEHGAHSGSIVIMDPSNGAVVAMADQPTFNPNVRSDYMPHLYRNRAVTNAYEPGSTMKPFTLSAALLSGRYTPNTEINTSPGWYMLAGHTIKDDSDFGRINLTQVLQVSSNVAASKISLSLPPYYMWSMYHAFGFGQVTHSGFPGESSGILHNYTNWRPIDQATMAYGYGIAVTSLQLAHAYCGLANGGVLPPVTFVQPSGPVSGTRVLPAHVANQMRNMLRSVVTPMGTGYAAHIPGYTVAGKTGTAHRLTRDGSYAKDKYTAVFAGIVPASRPRLVAVVMIDDPQGSKYYGGQVAAPVFREVMSGAMRLLDIPPDDIDVVRAGPVSNTQGSAA